VLALRPTVTGGWHARALPAHASAAGKLLLAHHHRWRSERLASPLGRCTDATVVDPERLAAELETIRLGGFAREREEHVPGWHAVAVPLRPGHDASQAVAVSVGWDAARAGATDSYESVAQDIVGATRSTRATRP